MFCYIQSQSWSFYFIGIISSIKRFKKVFIGISKPNVGGDSGLADYVGKKAVVTQDIKPNLTGKVEFHGTDWEAEADGLIPAGAAVEIIGKKNITLIVKQIT